jgi:hypothetical protein
MFEKAVKTLTQDNKDLKERMLALDSENEELKNLTSSFKDEYTALKDQNTQMASQNKQLVNEVMKLQQQPNQNFDFVKRPTTSTHSAIRESQKARPSTNHLMKKDIIIEARESSDERSESRMDHTISQSQEEGYTPAIRKYLPSSNRSTNFKGDRKHLDILRASNKLLQEQNETLRIKTLLMEERKKMEKDDTNKVELPDNCSLC